MTHLPSLLHKRGTTRPGQLCLNIPHPGNRDGQSAPSSFVSDSSSIMGHDNASKSTSRVSLDHFDPDGVQELSRTLSQSSHQARRKSVRSENTLAPEQSFSLEKTLRAALDKYVPSHAPGSGSCLTAFIGNMVRISRDASSACTLGTFALPVLAPRRLTKRPLGLCLTPRLS